MRLKPFFLNASENVQNNWLQHLVSKGKEKSYLKQKNCRYDWIFDRYCWNYTHTHKHTHKIEN